MNPFDDGAATRLKTAPEGFLFFFFFRDEQICKRKHKQAIITYQPGHTMRTWPAADCLSEFTDLFIACLRGADEQKKHTRCSVEQVITH